MQKFSVIIPVYNEEMSLKKTLGELLNSLKQKYEPENYEIIIVNDGSTDQSLKILQTMADIKIINHPENIGYGAALKNGIRQAKYDWIMITDADATYSTQDALKLLEQINNDYDMIIGARTNKNARVPLIRRPAKKILNILANFLVNKKIPDLNSGLRLFKKSLTRDIWHLFPNGFSFTSTLTLAGLVNGYRIKFIPIDYHQRIGQSTLRPTEFFNFLILITRIVMYFNPLKFFLVPGIILMLMALSFIGLQAIINQNISDLGVLIFIASFQIILIGLLADLIVKSRK